MRQWQVDSGDWKDVTPEQPRKSFYRRAILPKLEFLGCLSLVTLAFIILFGVATILNPANGYAFPEPQVIPASRNVSVVSGFSSGFLCVLPILAIVLLVSLATRNGKIKESSNIKSFPFTEEELAEFRKREMRRE